MTEKVVNIKDISIINNRVLKVGSARFVIDKIRSYEEENEEEGMTETEKELAAIILKVIRYMDLL